MDKLHTSAQRQESSEYLGRFLLLWALLFGVVIRFLPAVSTDFPINDGGLFYVMAEDVSRGGYALPNYTSYNAAQIPFAYPPLGIYLAALSSGIFKIPLLQLFRWLPPLITTAMIPVFYLLARAVTGSQIKAGLASVAYAFLPHSFVWLVMGGGITRSLGYLFSLLVLYHAYLLFTRGERKRILYAALFGGMTILSHPEAALQTVLLGTMLWLFLGRTKRSTLAALGVAAGVALIVAPWLVTVISRHGLVPFQAAAKTGGYSVVFWLPLLTFDFTEEPFLTLISVMGVLGFILLLARREFLLPAWFVLPFLVGPRGAPADATVPLAIAAGIGLSDVILPGIARARRVGTDERPLSHFWENDGWRDLAALGVLGFFLVYSLITGYSYSLTLTRLVPSKGENAALAWVRDSTPAESRFVLITKGEALSDPLQEWFPALTERVNQGVVQGYEWMPDGQFMSRYVSFAELQACALEGIACLEAWVDKQGDGAEFIWLSRGGLRLSEGKVPFRGRNTPLAVALSASPDYVLVYGSEEVKIFAHR